MVIKTYILQRKIIKAIEPIRDDNKAVLLKWTMIRAVVCDVRHATSSKSCRYCQKYYRNGCKNCPIAKEVGDIDCTDTPYFQVAEKINELVDAINKEITFLESISTKKKLKAKKRKGKK